MMAQFFPPNRRALVPEVVQTSAMDCGPATLKAMLEGFNISVSYGRLREACQTDVDGTSIDTIEEVAVQLGLNAEQIMLPADHLLLPEAEALPAIVVVKKPNGLTHFVVIWQVYGQFLQVMDPAVGRRWLPRQRLLNELYQHQFPVPLAAWREWAGSEGFVAPLRRRLNQLRLETPAIDQLLDAAVADPDWYGLAALDAATRMVESIVQAGGVERGAEAAAVLRRFLAPAADSGGLGIPAPFWSVQPFPAKDADEAAEPYLTMRGAVLIRVTGLRADAPGLSAAAPAPLSPDLLAALSETPPRPEQEMLTYLRADGLLSPAILLIALALSTGAVMLEAMMLRGLLTLGTGLGTVGQRLAGLAALFIFLAIMLLLELPIAATALRVGRRFETRLRIAFLEKIPRLGDKYFHSRLTSDMTQRVHDLSQMRQLPNLGLSLARLAFQLLLTVAGVVILVPGSAILAFLSMAAAVGVSLLSQPLLREQDLRMRTHTGALSRFYLEAMLGLFPVRTHGAERAVRREHEGLLVEWLRSGGAYYRLDVGLQTVSAVVSTFFSVWILFDYVNNGGDPSGIFLLFYWTLSLPALGLALADVAQQYPIYRSRMLRVLEPLGAPNETDFNTAAPEATPATPTAGGVSLTLANVSVQAGGHPILTEINLHLKPGEHIGIVGPSGAGKSSLVGLLLGWHRPAAGQILVDGEPLAGQRLYHLRRETAWVDPAVQLWNRSLLDNLRYGAESDITGLNQAIDQADLFAVLEKLPQGQQTPLGEGGGLVSGGEGQRVRLGRAMLRPGVRLAILDEPFRGLDRAQRRSLLQQSRGHWAGATLICITHDVGETRHFERVLVIENGRIIEDGPPDSLLAQPHSRYGELLAAEEAVRQGMWGGEQWRHLRLAEGQLHHDQ